MGFMLKLFVTSLSIHLILLGFTWVKESLSYCKIPIREFVARQEKIILYVDVSRRLLRPSQTTYKMST